MWEFRKKFLLHNLKFIIMNNRKSDFKVFIKFIHICMPFAVEWGPRICDWPELQLTSLWSCSHQHPGPPSGFLSFRFSN
jgi:hypothetical protein